MESLRPGKASAGFFCEIYAHSESEALGTFSFVENRNRLASQYLGSRQWETSRRHGRNYFGSHTCGGSAGDSGGAVKRDSSTRPVRRARSLTQPTKSSPSKPGKTCLKPSGGRRYQLRTPFGISVIMGEIGCGKQVAAIIVGTRASLPGVPFTLDRYAALSMAPGFGRSDGISDVTSISRNREAHSSCL